MGDARSPQHLDQVGRRVGLYCIQRLARKLLYKEAGSARSSMRAVEDGRFFRRVSAGYGQSIKICVQLKGPPTTLLNKAALRLGSPHGAASGVISPSPPQFKTYFGAI